MAHQAGMMTHQAQAERRTGARVLHPWCALGALIAALGLTAIRAGSNVLTSDVAVTRGVQGAPMPLASDLAHIGYWIGATPVTVALAAFGATIFALVGHRAEALLLLGTIAARCLNPLLKWITDSPRPSSASVNIREEPSGLGFPSSHAMGVVILFGAIAYLADRLIPHRTARLTVQGLCLLAILITGFGRVYNGAHWPTDVIGGYLYGAGLLLLVIAAYRATRRPALRPMPIARL
ncbi:MAG: phosphatase PAP2 family protein [Thermomicrobiales bacterium]